MLQICTLLWLPFCSKLSFGNCSKCREEVLLALRASCQLVAAHRKDANAHWIFDNIVSRFTEPYALFHAIKDP